MNPWSYAGGDVEAYRRRLLECYHSCGTASLFAMIAAADLEQFGDRNAWARRMLV